MKTYVANRMGDYCSLQISSLKNLTGDYESKSPFLLKNITSDSITLEIKCVNNADYVETTIDPGWNPELCVGVKGGAGVIQIGK